MRPLWKAVRRFLKVMHIITRLRTPRLATALDKRTMMIPGKLSMRVYSRIIHGQPTLDTAAVSLSE